MRDFIWAFLFWQWFEILGLPLRLALARGGLPPECRRALSRVAGPALLSLPLWVAGHGVPGALSAPAAWVWLAAALAAGWLWGRRAPGGGVNSFWRMTGWDVPLEARPAARRRLAFQIIFEAVCFALYFGFVAFRRWVPEMTSEIAASAAEKFMNQMMFWANWHARALPAQDYWYAGHALEYYDWAHWHWAWGARVAGFPATLALNLALARVTLMTAEAAYLLARGLRLRAPWALGGAAAAAWFGNFDGVARAWALIQFSRQYHVPFDAGGYDFWGPSRAIKNVVDEFPAFSAILGDFHAHHLALPWLTAFLALLAWRPRLFGKPGGALPWGLTATAMALAATLANGWNLPILAFACGVWLLGLLAARPRALRGALPWALALGGLLLAALRFQRGGAPLPLDPPEPGAGWLARHGVMFLPAALRSTPLELMGLWGLPLAVAALAALARGVAAARAKHFAPLAALLMACSLALAAAGLFPAWRGVALWGGAIAVAMQLWRSPAGARRPGLPRLQPLGLAAAAAMLLLAMLEALYLQDRFRGELARYNSYFKFSYPAWPVLMLAGADGLRRLWRGARAARGAAAKTGSLAAAAAGALIALCGVVYPAFAIPARVIQAARGDDPPRSPTLDGVSYIEHRPPFSEEAMLLGHIREHVPAGDVIIEAGARGPAPFNGAYDYGGRIASLTGHPVPLGWIHHEQQWRGYTFFTPLEERGAAVEAFYNSPTPQAMRAAAKRLGAHWAVFGVQERKRYGQAALNTLLSAAQISVAFIPPGQEPQPGAGVFLFDFEAPRQSL